MKALWNQQVQQAEAKCSKKDQKWMEDAGTQQKQYDQEAENHRKRRSRRGVQENVTDRQVWEEHQRRSMEIVSSANGWMHTGTQKSQFFYPSILH